MGYIRKEGLERVFTNQYYLDYDYDDWSDPQEHKYCDYICRCSRITNLRITDVAVDSIWKETIEVLKKDYEEISLQHQYCIDRLFSIHKVWDTSLWEVGVIGGYYGDETDDATFSNFFDLKKDIYTVLDLDTDDAIKWILVQEYGFLLDSLKDVTFTVYDMSIDEITVPNTFYMNKVSSNESAAPSEIYGILSSHHGKYTIIDGYHRLKDAQNSKEKTVMYIVAEEK
jgi:hypothetical protein